MDDRGYHFDGDFEKTEKFIEEFKEKKNKNKKEKES
jgi:hypothetical protein